MRYKEICTVGLTAITVRRESADEVTKKQGVTNTEDRLHVDISNINNPEVNSLLIEGWEIIKVVTHTSPEQDMTGIAVVLGLPA